MIQPHPYANQQVAALARGPIVYCAEDVDNPREKNHFKNTILSPFGGIREEWRRRIADHEHQYVALHTIGSIRSIPEWENKPTGVGPYLGVLPVRPSCKTETEICFIPYYLRANRGGHGQMRVALLLEQEATRR